MREQRDKELLKVIRRIHEESRFSYGSPRVHAEATLGPGEPVNRKRVGAAHARSRYPGHLPAPRPQTRPRRPGHRGRPVHRGFDADAPGIPWFTDITEHPTAEGKPYCTVVLDFFSRRIAGRSIDIRQSSDLVINAMSAAATRRRPVRDKTIPHSDHGS
ncbi:DDE-type integrase/transposase/recombinase [Actinocorallia sp. B10E7]|uniref:DDE-type integrase/transposase/recombinase n=1 Tax=Actinocorallia sp. B10E7 TaxID=3153558 RepID=UPI00325DE455